MVKSSPITRGLRRLTAAVGAAVIAVAAAAAQGHDPAPPPQAAEAGFTGVILNADFTDPAYLAGNLSCAGEPQTKTWKQGIYWEGQNGPWGVAPCSLIKTAYDQVFGTNVLDLAWVAAQVADQGEDDVSISTFPLDLTSPSFAFAHGYVEVVARFPKALTTAGYFGAIWMVSDETIRGQNLPPWNWPIPGTEHDIIEIYGPDPWHPLPRYDSVIHEYAAGGTDAAVASRSPPPFDPGQPHKYGWLWTSSGEYQNGQVCAYLDDALTGCQPTTAYSEAFHFTLLLTMQVDCYGYTDRSCIGVPQMDLLVQRVTVFQ